MFPCWHSHTNTPTALCPLAERLDKGEKSFHTELTCGKSRPGCECVQGSHGVGEEWVSGGMSMGLNAGMNLERGSFTLPFLLRVWWRSRCSCSLRCQPHQGGRQPTGLSSAEEGLQRCFTSLNKRGSPQSTSETENDQLTSSALNLSHWVVKSSSRLDGAKAGKQKWDIPKGTHCCDMKDKGESSYNSFLMAPVPSGSRTLKALTITSSGSAPNSDKVS